MEFKKSAMETTVISKVVYDPAENVPFKIVKEHESFTVTGDTFAPKRNIETIDEATWILVDWLRKVAIERIKGADVEMINRGLRRRFSLAEIQSSLLSRKMNQRHYSYAFKKIREADDQEIYIHIDADGFNLTNEAVEVLRDADH